MGKTTISWTQETWPVLRGCSRCSPGCENCYAEKIAMRFSGPGQAFEGYAKRGKGWTRKVSLLIDGVLDALSWRTHKLRFISMSDPFHENLSNQEIAALFGVMAIAKGTFQILTKRAKRMREWFKWLEGQVLHARDVCHRHLRELLESHGHGDRIAETQGDGTWPLPNVWLGVSVENQEYANARIPYLLDCPAVVRFLSCEPLLGQVDLENVRDERSHPPRYVNALMGCSSTARGRNKRRYPDRVHWVIAGAESGPGKRPCEVEWLRSLRDQCWPGSTKFFLKQADMRTQVDAGPGATISELYPIGLGKGAINHKAKGVVELPYLDGEQWNQMPEIEAHAA
jgi:protein gp37